MRGGIYVIALIMAGCATLVGFTPDVLREAVFPTDIAKTSRTVDYKLRLDKGGRFVTILMHLEANPEAFTIVGLGPLGGALFSCQMVANGSKQTVCDVMDSDIPAHQLYTDMMLVYTPFAILEKKMGYDFDVSVIKNFRRIDHKGRLFATVTYSDINDLMAGAVFENYAYGYSFQLERLHMKDVVND